MVGTILGMVALSHRVLSSRRLGFRRLLSSAVLALALAMPAVAVAVQQESAAPETAAAPEVTVSPARLYPRMSPGCFMIQVSDVGVYPSTVTYVTDVVSVDSQQVLRSFTATLGAEQPLVMKWDIADARGAQVRAGLYDLRVSRTDESTAVSQVASRRVRVLSLADVARRAGGKRAKSHAVQLASLGPRQAGSRAERKAGRMIRRKFVESGYPGARRERVVLPNGRTTYNIIAVKKAVTDNAPIIIIGAHMDSKATKRSPGGNDNASGVGVLLEVSRVMQTIPTTHEIWFVAFAAEEGLHAGSRSLARKLTRRQMRRGVQMVNLDMVGVGTKFRIGTQRGATRRYAIRHLRTARQLGYSARFAWHGAGSDHEAFVKRGIPVAYYDRIRDPWYHTRRDTAGRLSVAALRQTSRALVASLVTQAAD